MTLQRRAPVGDGDQTCARDAQCDGFAVEAADPSGADETDCNRGRHWGSVRSESEELDRSSAVSKAPVAPHVNVSVHFAGTI
ncbi:hypothetical protein GCM10020255_068060 [Rhodococcus baikonurensis]